jgi:hypothetical protein
MTENVPAKLLVAVAATRADLSISTIPNCLLEKDRPPETTFAAFGKTITFLAVGARCSGR